MKYLTSGIDEADPIRWDKAKRPNGSGFVCLAKSANGMPQLYSVGGPHIARQTVSDLENVKIEPYVPYYGPAVPNVCVGDIDGKRAPSRQIFYQPYVFNADFRPSSGEKLALQKVTMSFEDGSLSPINSVLKDADCDQKPIRHPRFENPIPHLLVLIIGGYFAGEHAYKQERKRLAQKTGPYGASCRKENDG